MKAVHSEVVVKILETFHQLKSDGTIAVSEKLKNCQPESTVTEDEEDRLILLFLEEELSIRGISELSQLPIGGEKSVVQFAYNLPTDTTLFTILQKLEFTECIPFPTLPALQCKMTLRSRRNFSCASLYLTGTGYHSLADQSTYQDGVFDLGDLIYPTLIGFALPQHLSCTRIGKMYDKFRVFRSPSHYASVRHQELGIPVLSSNGVKGQAEPKLGNNIGHKKAYGDIAFTFVREYRQFSIHLDPVSCSLQPTFVQKVKELTASRDGSSRGQSQPTEESWREFFETYGTHVITSANGGGRIIVTVLENHLKNYFGVTDLSRRDKVQEIEQVLSNLLDSDEVNQDAIPKWQSTGAGLEGLLISSIRLEGGDPAFAGLDLTECHKPGERKSQISKWSQTLPFSPIMLDTSISIQPLANILDDHGMSQEAKMVDLATQKIFGKSFWKPSSRSEGRSWAWTLGST